MSDKELSNYIKTIDPKFNSDLEKGTIEMTNEYYNLLEEYISRLNNKKDLYKSVLDKIKEYIENLLKEEFEVIDEDSVDYGKKFQRAYFSDSELGKILELLEEIE